MRYEKGIEDRTVQWARKRGWMAHKVKFGDAGYPDRVFINLYGFHIYIEFKYPGQEPDPIQYHRLKQLIDRGVTATWTDNYDDAIGFLYKFESLRTPRISVTGNTDDDGAGGSGSIPGPRSG